MTLVDALKFTVEELQEKSLEELQELHNILSASKQKKARLQADLVAGIMNAKQKEQAKAQAQQEEQQDAQEVAATVENSVKVKPKKKVTTKKKADAEAQAEQKEEDKPKKAPKKKVTAKKADAGEKPLEEMSKEELLAYVKAMQEKQAREIFPEVIEGEKVRFTQIKLETIQDIQKLLVEKPYQLYLFADERLNELTQFIVLFANDEIIVLLDRNQQRNTTVTLKTEQLKADHIVFEKEGKFAYRFYIREAKQEEQQEEKSE